MRRLSLTIFLSLLASLFLMACAVAFFWQWRLDNRTEAQESRFTEALAGDVIPAAAEGVMRLQQSLEHWQHRLHIDLAVIDAQGRVLAAAGHPFGRMTSQPGLPASVGQEGPVAAEPDTAQPDGHAPREDPHRIMGREAPRAEEAGHHHPPMVATLHRVSLPDARTLLIRTWRPAPPRPPVSAPTALTLLFVAVGLAAWPVSRRITRRLEALRHSVDAQAAGDLQVRADVRGSDEVAALARSFNHAANRIEALVKDQRALIDSQRRLLANASHELRSPLARIRMAVELLEEHSQAPQLPHMAEVRRSIHELDELVEEILLASCLEQQTAEAWQREPVDMLLLVSREAERCGAVWMLDESLQSVPAGSILVPGDVRLLRRLLRNLLENARRYQPAVAEPVLMTLARLPGSAGPREGQAASGGRQPDTGTEPLVADAASGWLRIAVLDRGPGVPPSGRERIFEPFYRVDGHSEQAGNVGLGLALVRQIAERHGGDVHYESRPGGGSCFVVRLPV